MKNILTKLRLKSKPTKLVAVGIPVIIRNTKGEILLGKRSNKVSSFPDMWGLPGGLMDYGETPETAAKREVMEELGVEITVLKKSSEIYNVPPTKGNKFHSVNILFYARIKNGKPQAKDETQEIKWFKSSEIKNMELAYTHKEILKKEGLI